MPFLMIRNDITKVAADAIVNPANRNLLQGSGTSRAIYQAAGEQELTAACEAIGHCDLGRAVSSPFWKAPALKMRSAMRSPSAATAIPLPALPAASPKPFTGCRRSCSWKP